MRGHVTDFVQYNAAALQYIRPALLSPQCLLSLSERSEFSSVVIRSQQAGKVLSWTEFMNFLIFCSTYGDTRKQINVFFHSYLGDSLLFMFFFFFSFSYLLHACKSVQMINELILVYHTYVGVSTCFSQ